ncbi:hypothetical protein [Moorena sp. SIO3A2]|uniref:hypothetical protein n=1 Tax=Moorena sp. SIO3A2 TaxID=2607841 RepID=UPI0013B96BD9|nr:hypothetical protein [Moorena sp. SIO3A2]NER90259.1 hypothetical protein [Moorena sp. SIO3A2]
MRLFRQPLKSATPDSRFPTPYSRLPTPYSRLPTPSLKVKTVINEDINSHHKFKQ